VDGRAGGLTDGWTEGSKRELGMHEEEADDTDAAAAEEKSEDEDGELEEGRRTSNDLFGTCTRMAHSKTNPE